MRRPCLNQFSGAHMHFKFLALLIPLLSFSVTAGAQTCVQSKEINPLGAFIAKTALNEYAEFNGHRINADGNLWKFGSVESETELLLDPDSGQPDASRPGRYAWRRVWEYWLTLDKHVSGIAWSRKIFSVPGLLENPDTSASRTEISLRDLFRQFMSTDENVETALQQSAVRAALNDSPWSAAFISFLMDRVGLTDQQFRYSSAHWRYIQGAFETTDGYAYKACDPRRTTPKLGDLLCYARGADPLKNFAEWKDAVQTFNFSTPSHCEVVVDVDTDAKKIEVIGGNVLQSVTRRKLNLNEENVLSDSHNPDRFKPIKNSDCSRDQTCEQPNLNLQYWGVLLQVQ